MKLLPAPTQHTTSKNLVLQASTYDRLQSEAARYGGIGKDYFYNIESTNEGLATVPVCAHGLVLHLCPAGESHSSALDRLGIHPTTSDAAVYRINMRKGSPQNARVPFQDWCNELNIVRGE